MGVIIKTIMKNIKSNGAPFDVILGGIPQYTLTPEWQMFDAETASAIISLYPQLIIVEDTTDADILENDGVKDVNSTK